MKHIDNSSSVKKFGKNLQKGPAYQKNKTTQKMRVLSLVVYKLHE